MHITRKEVRARLVKKNRVAGKVQEMSVIAFMRAN
jgi:hypothetical protein